MQRRKRQLKAKEAGKVEAGHVSAGAAVLGLISTAGAAAAMTKARGLCLLSTWSFVCERRLLLLLLRGPLLCSGVQAQGCG